jgi:tetratricopeptide (TPR) repeat protein
MPYEMVETVQDITDLRAIERVGGDLELIKRFVAAGFPVLVEKGTYLTDLTGVKSWMGHYEVITGYSDPQGFFIAQDSFVGPDFEVAYDVMEKGWRAFNHTYLIIYPPDKDAQVLALLGPDADVQTNYQRAAQKASDEIYALQGIDKYFAWFNRGTNLRLLQDFAGAAEAYDQAFQVYPAIPEAERPWRMLWYQTGPYFAYFYAGRYWDVLNLADATLNNMQSEKNIEETYYWRGMAKAALGDTTGASEDYQTALKYHPGFEPATYQLEQLGISP